MVINITKLFAALVSKPLGGGNAVHYSGSATEHGPDAGKITWRNCLRNGEEYLRNLTDAEEYVGWDDLNDVIRDYAKSFGAWTDYANWSIAECCAFLLQDIASAIREWDAVVSEFCPVNDWGDAWAEYRGAAECGRVHGNLSCDDVADPERNFHSDVYYTFGD